MNKKIFAIVAVVIVVAAGATAVLALNKGGEGKFSPNGYPGSYLTVLGNADLDLDIDSDDASKIQELVDSGKSYSYKDYYMYDADYNGSISSSDVDLVKAIVSAQSSGDWSKVGTVHYVNVDKDVASYDMTKGNKVITLIAPPLDSVLAMGGKDLVVGFDNRITTGKYHSEYARTFDFSKMIDVGAATSRLRSRSPTRPRGTAGST